MEKKNHTSFIVFFLLLALDAFILPNDLKAQSDNRGMDFWVCFPQNARSEFNAGLNFKLYITGDIVTNGTVIIPGNTPIPFTINPGEIIGIDIDTLVQVMGSEEIKNLGVHVHSDQPIAVFGLSNRKASTDTYVAFPTNVLGASYRAMCYAPLPGTEDAFTSQITFVAIEDNTIVTVNPTGNTKGGRHAGEIFSVTLQRGEVYQIQGTTRGDGRSDLTGTLVTSTKPIAFFTGHTCAQVPANVNFCDQLLEEEAPIATWGKQFFVSKLLGKDWYVVRIIANEEDTKIFINGKFIKSLAAGEYFEAQHLKDNVMITSDKPVLIGQYATSSDADSVKVGDPFLMLIAPTEQFLQSYRFVTPIGQSPIRYNTDTQRKKELDSSLTISKNASGMHYADSYIEELKKEDISGTGWHHYINIIVPSTSVNSLRLDGASVTSNKFTALGITRFAISQIEIPFGSHSITCDRPFGLYSYGFGIGSDNYDSYGNCAGQRIAPIERIADTSKPTLEIARSDSADDLVLIARDDRINDLGLATIIVTDSSNIGNPVSYPVFDIGAPVFRFSIKRTILSSCLYVKLQDFAKNQSYYALCPASPNSSGASNEILNYNITPLLLEQLSAHEVYPIEIYPSPAKYGQPVNINFRNSLPETIGVQVLDEAGNIVTELQKKELMGSGPHTLTYNSDKYVAGNFFLRFTAYSQNDQVIYRQDEHFVVAH